jgi:heme-degrading monooxygenase HmoA
MIRLTVLYNLPENESEDAFLEWRLSEHQDANASMPGVIRTDFARVVECWPEGSMPAYRYQTTADWPDRESFDNGFHSDTVQANLRENLKKLGDYSFMVSEILVESSSQ